jgi:5-deoxy-glucuronate isomerase
VRVAELHLPLGSAGDGVDPVVVTPQSANWAHCGLHVMQLRPGETRSIETGDHELAVLPLSGGRLTVAIEGAVFELAGRRTVFDRVTDWAYAPAESVVRLTGDEACEVALASARAEVKHAPAAVAARDVPVEIRGAGRATRQVTNFLMPGVFDGAEKLICCEVLTPDGNWSSYPPHKHDATEGSPVDNEEIYYFRIGRSGTTEYAPEGYGIHRTYTHDGSVDATVTVRDGDVFLVPKGYHGPCAAAPGYPMYYLNVMAGPAPGRTFAFVDDPPHQWIRSSWEDVEPDPRCPLTTAEGPTWRR